MRGQPRKKDEIEITWSQIKRAITARVNFQAQVWRERRLNEALDAAWKAFERRVNAGELPRSIELELEEPE